ncbi:MAG: uracil-DNA glycosylase [Zoogloea oleivorans]|uniref:Type-4 uracil-DNA glycosylase n=2 Tax=Zoogloeaceae TaxID=2008794 RepID=A0A6C2D123_9RHOO|nr:uracil-DNA glycosylase [Zoogloea oleivorans]MDY0034537.1 uracil-DNA glycosylase [Zoogloea oleivorans]TYC59616.1 uracil-DNA glycosylase [Zoogloea oleivorans]
MAPVSLRTRGILREMGLAPLWRLRGVEDVAVDAPAQVLPESPVVSVPLAAAPVAPSPALARPVEVRATLREALAPLAPVVEAVAPRREFATDLAGLGWDELEARIRACDACGLCKRRKQAVPGVGDRQADWLFVGEGPGAEEDERGEPFVGQAGRLLDNMLGTIDLKRGEDVYIANAVKCRPPNNRTPEAAELAACFPYLSRQIALIKPRLIVALGRPAAQALLNQEIKIGAVRGKLFSHASIPVVVTYHPAYLLRNMADKAKAWEDLCFARSTMRRLREGA